MRASKQEQTGSAGMSEVCGKFERIGWAPVRNQEHDLGTDLLIEARDSRRFTRGLIVGAQVKAGPSRFEDEYRGASGELEGWWYYESGTAHFDDWVTHGLPHLLVLHDLDADVSHWVHVTADRVIGTGQGCKILVPVGQTIDHAHSEELLAVAAQQKASPIIEGTAFHASAGAVPPGRRLRYALIVPRLVAPHRNLGHSTPISAEEALALCAQGRFLDLKQFAAQHASVPDPELPYDGRDWRWSFVRAVWAWAFEDDLAPLRRAQALAVDSEAKAASGVLLACLLLRGERSSEALDVLSSLLDDDDLSPVDQGWVLVQRSRVGAEIGDIPSARTDAVSAQRQFQGDSDDLTASALAAAAAWNLFVTAGMGQGDLGGTLTASDTAVGWWRSQTIAWALGEASIRAFRQWSEDPGSRWSSEDVLALNLFAAELNADLTGEHRTWQAVAALAARHQLIADHAEGDEQSLTDALDTLRLSGEDSSLKLAVNHLRATGPIAAVAEAIRKIGSGGWTHTTAKSNLTLLALAGDLVAEDDADAWIEMLVGILEGGANARAFVERVRPTFTVNLEVAEAIAGTMPAASRAGRRRVAEFLISKPGPIPDLLVSPVIRWVRGLKAEDLTSEVREGLRALGATDSGRVGAQTLGWLARNDDGWAKEEVYTRAIAGDLHALSAMGDVTVLTSEQAESLIEKFESIVAATVEEANKSVWMLGGFDGAHGLALFNIWFPDVARWQGLIALLTHPTASSKDKRGALGLIAELSERVPNEVRKELADNMEAIASVSPLDDLDGKPVGGLPTTIGIVTGAVQHEAADVAVARLARGSQQERCDAADLLGRGWCERMRPLLSSLVADHRANVREAAGRAVGRLASSHPDAVVIDLARLLSEDRGTFVPSALLVGLSRGGQKTDLGREVADRLIGHPSARVRTLAQQFLAWSQEGGAK